MARIIAVCIVAMLAIGQQLEITQAKKSKLMEYNLDDAVEDLNFFIPGSKIILTTAIKLWRTYGEVKTLLKNDPNGTQILESLEHIEDSLEDIESRLDEISSRLDQISDQIAMSEIAVVAKIEENAIEYSSLSKLFDNFFKRVGEVDDKYTQFLDYARSSVRVNNDSLLPFVDSVTTLGDNHLMDNVNEMHNVLTRRQLHDNMLKQLADNSLAVTMMCQRKTSVQQFLGVIYNSVMKVEVKVVVMSEFAFAFKARYYNRSYAGELMLMRERSFLRLQKTIRALKEAMIGTQRDFWLCDPDHHIEGVTYAKLGPFLQAYISKEKDATYKKSFMPELSYECLGQCSDRNYALDGCVSNYCRRHQRRCDGFLRNCAETESKLNICLAGRASSRRYNYIEMADTNKVLGHKNDCTNGTSITVKSKQELTEGWRPQICDYCLCTCESKSTKMTRFFDLANVTSDLDNNMIVTGARLKLDGHLLKIEIQQGELSNNGNINASSVHWQLNEKTYDTSNLDATKSVKYMDVTYDRRTVHLDNLIAPTGSVLTGLRFRRKIDALQLQMQVTPFDFATGKLYQEKSEWKSQDVETTDRTEVTLPPSNKRNLPTSAEATKNNLDSSDKQYVKFTTSSLESDAGQTVVPFIDLQALSSVVPVPLSGVALIHKGSQWSAGFLALKLYSYNYAQHIEA